MMSALQLLLFLFLGLCLEASARRLTERSQVMALDAEKPEEEANIQHEGEDCWEGCNGKPGLCAWCGTGMCCHSSGERREDPAECKGVTHKYRKGLFRNGMHACIPAAEGSEKPEEEETPPEKPDEEQTLPEKPDEEETRPEKPDEEEKLPEKPDEDETTPEKPDEEEKLPEKPDEDETTPEKPDEEETPPEKPDEEEMTPEKPDEEETPPEDEETPPEKPDEEEMAPEKLDEEETTPEKPEDELLDCMSIDNFAGKCHISGSPGACYTSDDTDPTWQCWNDDTAAASRTDADCQGAVGKAGACVFKEREALAKRGDDDLAHCQDVGHKSDCQGAWEACYSEDSGLFLLYHQRQRSNRWIPCWRLQDHACGSEQHGRFR